MNKSMTYFLMALVFEAMAIVTASFENLFFVVPMVIAVFLVRMAIYYDNNELKELKLSNE